MIKLKLKKLLVIQMLFISSCKKADIKQYTVTFTQQNQPDVLIKVDEGGSITELPPLMDVEGYSSSWEDVDLTNISSDIVVNAVYTIKSFVMKYDAAECKNDSYLIIEYTEKEFTYNTEITLLVPECKGYTFDYWLLNDTKYESSTYVIKTDVTFKAKWTINHNDERWWSDNF